MLLPGLIVCAAFFGESLFGFGGGLVSIPLISISLGVRDAIVFVLFFQFLMGVLLIWSYKNIEWRFAVPMTIGLLLGTLIGTYMLGMLSEQFLLYILAGSILVFLIKMIFFSGLTFGTHTEQRWGFIAGLIGGWFQGIIGIGGPILTMYLTVATESKAAFRATLIYLLFLTSAARLALSFQQGLISEKVVGLALPVIPIFLAVIIAGQFIHKKIDDTYYRSAVYLILFISAITLLSRAF